MHNNKIRFEALLEAGCANYEIHDLSKYAGILRWGLKALTRAQQDSKQQIQNAVSSIVDRYIELNPQIAAGGGM
jgi:hypothetical protein